MVQIIKNQEEIDQNILPIFATGSFLKSRSQDYGWFKNEKFILPFIVDNRYTIRRLIFTTSTIYLSSLTDSQSLLEKEFLNEVVQLAQEKLNVDFISKSQSNAVFNIIPDNSIFAPWGTYIIDLTQDIDDIFKNFKPNTRNEIRKAIKNGVIVKEISDIGLVHSVINETFKRQNEPLGPTKEYLYKINRNLGKNFKHFCAEKDGVIQGVASIPFNTHTGYYYYGGSINNPYKGSLLLLQFEIMKELKELGVNYYDLMGARLNSTKDSKYSSIQFFKEKFNPVLSTGYTFKIIFKKSKYLLYNFLLYIYYLFHKGKYKGDPIDQILKNK